MRPVWTRRQWPSHHDSGGWRSHYTVALSNDPWNIPGMKDTQAVASLAALAHQHRLAIFRLLVKLGPSGMPAGDIADDLRVRVSNKLDLGATRDAVSDTGITVGASA